MLFKRFHPLMRLNRRRELFVEQHHQAPELKALVSEPECSLVTTADELSYIVLDLETTGLQAESDLILSMGWVEIDTDKINLNSASHLYINEESSVVPETAVINHITPQMLRDGISLSNAMTQFFEAAAGKVIIAHACGVEKAFIDRYLDTYYQVVNLPILWIDTLAIEKNMAKARNEHDLDYSLSSTRERYGLPEYNNHNALIDAVSTAELFLAQKKRLSPTTSVPIAKLYSLSHK